MRPIKLVIEGDFWDSQIYRGRLYLWRMDGVLCVYRWDDFVSGSFDPNHALAMTYGFARSDYLYRQRQEVLFRDSDEIELLRRKFMLAAAQEWSLGEADLRPYLFGEQDNPFHDRPIDMTIYRTRMLAATRDGLFAAGAHRPSQRYPVSSRPQKLTDLFALSISAGYGSVALAAGDEGLYEFDLPPAIDEERLYQLSTEHSSLVNWAHASIFSSSPVGKGGLFAFEKVADRLGRFCGPVWQDDIFHSPSGFSWGVREKLYRSTPEGLEVVQFDQAPLMSPRSIDGPHHAGDEDISGGQSKSTGESHTALADSVPGDERRGEARHFGGLHRVGTVPGWAARVLSPDPKFLLGVQQRRSDAFRRVGLLKSPVSGSVLLSAGAAMFGVILEFIDQVVILRSDGATLQLPGEVTRWRCFPRSRRYENQLHLVYDNRLEMYSFNHDYFVDQDAKLAGISWREPRRPWS